MDVNGLSINTFATQGNEEMAIRKGPWTMEEDSKLIDYINLHGEGRWNSVAQCAGLKRTGKSCRLRWLNYLSPNVRRGNITLQEQFLIFHLHSHLGNRWSKIAQHLPGRTDNEVKNFWRTRIQKLAKQLKCDVNSQQFVDTMTMRYLWLSSSSPVNPSCASPKSSVARSTSGDINETGFGAERAILDISSDSLDAQVSPVSVLANSVNYIPTTTSIWCNGLQEGLILGPQLSASLSCSSRHEQGFYTRAFEQSDIWFSGGNSLEYLLNDEDIYLG